MDIIRRPGTRFVCHFTPEVARAWARLKRAAARGDKRLMKKAYRAFR